MKRNNFRVHEEQHEIWLLPFKDAKMVAVTSIWTQMNLKASTRVHHQQTLNLGFLCATLVLRVRQSHQMFPMQMTRVPYCRLQQRHQARRKVAKVEAYTVHQVFKWVRGTYLQSMLIFRRRLRQISTRSISRVRVKPSLSLIQSLPNLVFFCLFFDDSESFAKAAHVEN